MWDSDKKTTTARDRAIGLLAIFTGLRCCDITNLTLCSIDWNNDIIYIKQQKTEVPLELPLTAVVGNAIYDYLTSERPATNAIEIFVRSRHPYTKLHRGSLGNISIKIMN